MWHDQGRPVHDQPTILNKKQIITALPVHFKINNIKLDHLFLIIIKLKK